MPQTLLNPLHTLLDTHQESTYRPQRQVENQCMQHGTNGNTRYPCHYYPPSQKQLAQGKEYNKQGAYRNTKRRPLFVSRSRMPRVVRRFAASVAGSAMIRPRSAP